MRRTRVRSLSVRREQSRPLTSTRPPSAVSKRPAMCSSVDLPAPDGPTSATAWPGWRSMLAPLSTWISRSPWRKTRRTSRSCSTERVWAVSCTGLLVAEGFHGIEPGSAPGWIEGGQHRQHQSHQDDDAGGLPVEVCRQLGEVIDAGIEDVGAGQPGDELPDVVDPPAEDDREEEAGQRADHANGRSRNQEHAQDSALGGAHGAEYADLAALVFHQHDEAGDDVEGRHHDDDREDDEH